MIGAAAESMALDLRDAVVAGATRTGRTPAKDLTDFRIKRVIDALYKELEMQQGGMPASLWEQFQAYWPAFIQQIRGARNDVGHPASCEPVTVSPLISEASRSEYLRVVNYPQNFFKHATTDAAGKMVFR